MQPGGDLCVATTSMQIYQQIDGQFLQPYLQILAKAKLIIVDSNISASTLQELIRGKSFDQEIWSIAVSTPLVKNIAPALSGLDGVIVNQQEACFLANSSEQIDLDQVAEKILQSGVKNLLITKGDKGVNHYSQQRKTSFPASKQKIIDSNGAGDAFASGFFHQHLKQNSIEQKISFAQKCARSVLASPLSVLNTCAP